MKNYSIIQNLQDTPADISLGQLLQVSLYLREKLNRGLKRASKIQIEEENKETIDDESVVKVHQTTKIESKVIPMRVQAGIYSYKTNLILDSGSFVSLISKTFLAKLY